jgi:predicted nucleic acid-binding protein
MQDNSEEKLGMAIQSKKMILCDTNIFIEVYRDNPHITSIIESLDKTKIAVSDIICAELFFGAINKHELHCICKDLEELVVLPIMPEISTMAVELVKKYCLSHKLHIVDALIAATAIYHDVELYTLNVKDFIFIPGLKLYLSEF